ncbi:MAG TPA: hypothetical protein VN611_12030 [Patescibacteria group bacterium]|nr:hypothetical protein [Patescibacteria group bacterium]
MCGIHWYRELLERADQDKKKLTELLTMLQERYQIPCNPTSDLPGEEVPPTIWEIYQEVCYRMNTH